jgi:hypothetical protein
MPDQSVFRMVDACAMMDVLKIIDGYKRNDRSMAT